MRARWRKRREWAAARCGRVGAARRASCSWWMVWRVFAWVVFRAGVVEGGLLEEEGGGEEDEEEDAETAFLNCVGSKKNSRVRRASSVRSVVW